MHSPNADAVADGSRLMTTLEERTGKGGLGWVGSSQDGFGQIGYERGLFESGQLGFCQGGFGPIKSDERELGRGLNDNWWADCWVQFS